MPQVLATILGFMAILGSAGPPESTKAAQTVSPTDLQEPSTAVLSHALKDLLVQVLPGTLYEGAPGWGKTTKVANGLKWLGQGLQRHPEVQYTLRNDGLWRKVRVTADDLAHSLQVSLSDLQTDQAGHMTFVLTVQMGLRARVEQQKWQAGVRLYSTSARARLRVKLTLHCEASLRLELAGGLLPEFVFQFRVVESQVAYDHLVVEHLAGMGGTGARWLGELVRATIHELRPSLEKSLLARASAAIVRAGDSREVRLGIGGLLPNKTGSH